MSQRLRLRFLDKISSVAQNLHTPWFVLLPTGVSVTKVLMFIVMLFPLLYTSVSQVNPSGQGATIWFYRPTDWPYPGNVPTVHEVGGITRQLAKLPPGEFFGYSLGPGVHVFSYTRAPARGESLSVPIKAGEQAFVEVQFRELKQVPEAEGIEVIRKLRPMSAVNAIDKSVFVDSTPVRIAAETIAPVMKNESTTVLQPSTDAPLRQPSGPSKAPGPMRERLPFQPLNSSETFTKATLHLLVDGKMKEVEANVKFDKNAFVVIEKKEGTPIKTFSYSSIRSGEYSFGKSPRWMTALLVSPLFLFTGGEKHWFMVESDSDYALLQLDKSNYKLILASFEDRTGNRVETVEESR